ncbi:SAP domain-containing protein [uncultured Methanobrevibacter sp.]|uniref:SAP domain-containing protein n=1 Tax=uncultured Methanobrevibacter sp. TaxID=253161 RepID=UPI0025CCA9CC|nr:SAP domain-containing protein [uncultured Methanobrevibacter sp.]
MTKKKKNLNVESEEDSNFEVLTAKEVSNKYTVAELRVILKENGLSTSGKKKDLVERVLPILNDDFGEASNEESEVEKVDLSPQVAEDPVTSALSGFGINYDELAIKDKISEGGDTSLNIEGFTQNGLSMSDSTMSIVAASDSSNVDLKMNIPEVSYTDFESTVFTFKGLDLSILPSSVSKSLELSALLNSLEVITERDYINLKDLDFIFKAFPDENGITLDVKISNFLYPNFNNGTFNFENLDFNMAIGADEQKLNISINLPSLNLISKDYKVSVSDLNLNIALADLNLSDLELSVSMADFKYTNFDDVHVNMDNVNVCLDPIVDASSFDVVIGMDSFDFVGVTFDELFPMLNIDCVNFKNTTDDGEFPVNMVGHISPLDVYQMDLLALAALLSSGFDIDTYTRNMSSFYKGSFVDADDMSSAGISDLASGIAGIFENFDYSSLDSIVLDLSGLIDSAGIDLAEFGIDLSDYDVSAISVPEIVDALNNSVFSIPAITSVLNLLTSGLENIDLSTIVIKIDFENFDISGLLASLNLSSEDISAILDMLENSDLDLGKIFENFDYSILDTIVLDLSGLIDSLGIDLAALGIDIENLDLSAIRLSEIMAILDTFEFDMSTISAVLKLLGIDVDELDLEGLIKSFDAENFDISALLASLNISLEDISAIIDMFNNSDLDFEKIFENFDYSCLDAIELNLSGLIDSLGIDLAALGIDLSDYDVSAIKLSEIMEIFNNSEFDMATISAVLKLLGLDVEKLDLEGLITSFDAENFDMSSLLASLNLEKLDIEGITSMFENSDIDWESMFENCDYSSLDGMVLDLSGLIDSAGIDLAEFGIDESDYDFSAISLPDLIGIFNNPDYDMSEFDLSSIDIGGLDVSSLIASFDAENFDISPVLASLNISSEDLSAIIEIFNNPDLNLDAVFENCDHSCFGAIELNLSGLIDSLGIDLADLGIDLSDYDLSAIKLSDLIDILNNCEFDMSTLAALLKLVGVDVDDLDLEGLIASFDVENFDISAILAGLNLSSDDLSKILEIFTNSDIDLDAIFRNFDYSCFGAIVLDLSGLIDSLGIDLAALGIDLSDYDVSAISLSDLIDIFNNYEFDMSTVAVLLKLAGLEIDDLDLEGLIKSIDFENIDMSALLASFNISLDDLTAISEMFENPDFDLAAMLENCDYSCLDAVVLDLSEVVGSVDIDFDSLDINLKGYDLSEIRLSDVIDILRNSEFVMTAANALLKVGYINWDELDMSGLIVSFDVDELDMSALLTSLDVAGFDIEVILSILDMYGFDLSEFLNQFLGMFMKTAAPEIADSSDDK